jgi:cysteinyl-tRNA synthetase
MANCNSRPGREWYPPNGDNQGILKLYNSLIDEKVPFVPAAGPGSKQISWYTCGPTVYDSAHMGHARNYVTFDVIRRVLEDYFGYNILYVMNVTDVDDKIILRARRNHLLQQYKQEQKDTQQVRNCGSSC